MKTMTAQRHSRRGLHLASLLLIALLSACNDSPSDGSHTAEPPDTAEFSGETVVETGYITVSDGTRLRYHMQRFVAAPPGPVVMQYDGYDAGTGGYFSDIPGVKAQLMGKGYSILGVSVRGTGCSSGGFDLFDPQRAVDGAEAVEWAAVQPWSDGQVGMIGYSYPGITQLFVAAQQPEHLRAIAPSNVIFDLYRDVGSPGGIPNAAFASLFTAQQQAPGLLGVPQAVEQGDPECSANHLANRAAYESFLVEGQFSPHIDGAFDWSSRSPAATASQIEVPVLNVNYWQDEQTGSRVGGLLELGGLLEVLGLDQTWTVMSNGNHDLTWSHPLHSEMLVQFFEHYLRGIDNGWEATPRIQILHELSASELQPAWTSAFPEIPDPKPASLYLRAAGVHSNEAAGAAEGGASYIYPLYSSPTNPLPDGAGFLDQIWQFPAPEQGRVVWTTPALSQDLQLLGSASVDVWLASTAQDTDLQATISEVRPNGQEVYVARGWLRASKRALDVTRSEPTRPFHRHTEASVEALQANTPTLMRIEILPFAHRFRAGSALRLIIDAPLTLTGDWGPSPNPEPAVNTVLHDEQYPSRLVVGMFEDAHERPAARACGDLANQPCRDSIAPVPQGSLQLQPD